MGGITDDIIQRGVEALLALPTILVALVFVFTFGFGFWNVIFILSALHCGALCTHGAGRETLT